MNKTFFLFTVFILSLLFSQNSLAQQALTTFSDTLTPKQMLAQAYQLFKEGKDKESEALAQKVLDLGRSCQNDTLIGNALTSLCRNAQRSLDTLRLADLSEQLKDLATSTKKEKWLMYRAHQNAEMWRLVGNLDRADSFYNESLRLSLATGNNGMYTIDHFNKSFVSTAKGNFSEATYLIQTYYKLLKLSDSTKEDAYGLIALAYMLEQQGNYKGAHEVAVVTRRLFKEQNIYPEPPDEKPLLAVEASVQKALRSGLRKKIGKAASRTKVAGLLNKYLK